MAERARTPTSTLFSCEICGQEGLTDEQMRKHMLEDHIDGAVSCPFCELNGITANEMVVHVNTFHLDYLSPEDTDNRSQLSLNLNNSPVKVANVPTTSKQDNATTSQDNKTPVASGGFNGLQPGKNGVCAGFTDNRITVCPICSHREPVAEKLQEHINRVHFDLTSPSFPEVWPAEEKSLQRAMGGGQGQATNYPFPCPLCVLSYNSAYDLEVHVNLAHLDILSPLKSSQVTPVDDNGSLCPVCKRASFRNPIEMAKHVESHFADTAAMPTPNKLDNSSMSSSESSGTQRRLPNPLDVAGIARDISTHNGFAVATDGCSPCDVDTILARELDKREREALSNREQRDFELLQAQYGMDNHGSFREQSLTSMQRAVYTGEMTVVDYYNRQAELRTAEYIGVDDGHSRTQGLIPSIMAASCGVLAANAGVMRQTLVCAPCDHYASTYGDKGWGCGYRNLQMMLSALSQQPAYANRLLFNGKNIIPSISKIQDLIELAWKDGFDAQGCEQLGGRLANTRKWIGATEVVTYLAYFRVRCLLVDFHKPTANDGSHPDLFSWVLDYFSDGAAFKPPLYLQHQGHSRTIIGVEQIRDSGILKEQNIRLLVFDPSHSKTQLEQLNNPGSSGNAMRLLRRPLAAMKAKEYQIVAVMGTIDNDQEYQRSKVLYSQRIPPDHNRFNGGSSSRSTLYNRK